MKVKLNMKSPGFFFLGDISLNQTIKDFEVDLKEKADHVIAAVMHSVMVGKVTVDKQLHEILDLISDTDLKSKMAKRAGIVLPEVSVAEVKPSVLVNDIIKPVEEVVPSADEILGNLLTGGSKRVVENIQMANLSKDELTKILELESIGKNRIAVKTVISELIG